MKKTILTLAALGIATFALAQADVIEKRKGLFKEMGAASRPLGMMLKGEAPFELAKVKASLEVFSKNAKMMPALFPAGSDKGETTASPKIFEEKAKFDAAFVEFDKLSTAGLTGITDEATFKVAAGNILKACGTCHETYRVKK